jgi:archaellum component FlaC
MNKHFQDARYYLGRAADHAAEGLKEELEPLEERVREFVGRQKAPEPSRVEKIQSDLSALERRAEGQSKQAIADAREQLRKYREGRGDAETAEASDN